MDKLQHQVWVFYLVIGVAIVATFNSVSYFVANPVYQPDLSQKDFDFIKTARFSPTDELGLPLDDSGKQKIFNPKSNRQFQQVIFSPGNNQSQILQVLGEPVWKKPGFWQNSVAWSYENVVISGVDIGYIFDRQTGKLRQAEMAFPGEIDVKTMQLFLESLVNQPVESKLQKQMKAVQRGQSDFYNFRIDSLEGVVRRNQKDRLYIGVWEEDFH